ncbi:MAG: hypothetical protein ACAI35_02315 [Candidatus Methylacidiphilales bacterium]
MWYRITGLPILAYLLLATLCQVRAEPPTSENSETTGPVRVLRLGKLVVEVMDPLDPQLYNRGVRFTPVAAVLRVSNARRPYLYAPDNHDPIQDHGGLAAEFDLCTVDTPDSDLPPGYREAAVGDGFVKIGVGVLKKKKSRYTLFQQCELMEPAVTVVTWTDTSATFRQTCRGVNGYAYELAATVHLHGRDEVLVDWKLKNSGSKSFTTRHYTHNFFRLGDADAGPGYVLRFPYDFTVKGLEAQQVKRGREICFEEAIPKWVNAVIPYPDSAKYSGPFSCELRHAGNGQSIECETLGPDGASLARSGSRVALLRTDIHARAAYISPEQFIAVSLAPGEDQSWRKRTAFRYSAPDVPPSLPTPPAP